MGLWRVNALRWHVATGASQIQSVVKEGYVTLSGQVEWGFQKTSAESAVRHLMGVKGIMNNIVVKTATPCAVLCGTCVKRRT
jgi:osmotically-inducible protein OsmY